MAEEVKKEFTPPEREKDIKQIGIIQHLSKVADKLAELYHRQDLPEKNVIFSQYRTMLAEDMAMIKKQKKTYKDETLPEAVAKITQPIDENMVRIMDQCITAIKCYFKFIDAEEKDLTLLEEAQELLKDTSILLDETEDMLKVVMESIEMAGGTIIGEA